MKKRVLWLAVICLMVLTLVLSSCGQAPKAPTAPTAPTAPATAPATKAPTEEKKTAAPTVVKPKNGGVLRVGWDSDIIEFDDLVGRNHVAYGLGLTNEELLGGDWAKGPAGGYGTNEARWTYNTSPWRLMTGYLAESWEMPTKIEGEKATFVFHIRKGIRWGLNPDSEASRLVGGREVTVDDIVFSLQRAVSKPGQGILRFSASLDPAKGGAKIYSPAPWTVNIEAPWALYEEAFNRFTDYAYIYPPEVVKKWGDNAFVDWKNSVGTGAFMLTNVVPSSSFTFVKNPNYWMKDPIGPGKGSPLPYLDGVQWLIIPDKSTLQAALRTGKVDRVTGIAWEDAASLKKQTPQLMSAPEGAEHTNTISLRTDRKPFTDIRVRRAMFMAIDFEKIKKEYYGGQAEILTWPTPYAQEYAAAYLGLDDPGMPASVKELFTYNPEKAKKLLAEAGYPNGFKTWVDFEKSTEGVDYRSLIKDMWAKVGIDLELRPMEAGAYRTLSLARKMEQLGGQAGASPVGNLYKFTELQGTGSGNSAFINDPVVNQAAEEIQKLLVTDESAAMRRYKELMKYVLDQAWVIPGISPYSYTFWWPWLKNYSGEQRLAYNSRMWAKFVWLDQELKKSMGY